MTDVPRERDPAAGWAGGRGARERVLIVDDDPALCRLLEEILGHAGYRCRSAATAAAAREELRGGVYDVMLCDVHLPDASGIDVVEEARAASAHLAVLMISGLDESAVAERAIRAGAHAFVLKPFSATEVLTGILAALRQRQRERETLAELRGSYEETIQRLAVAIEARDPQAALHVDQMSMYCWQLAVHIGMSPQRCRMIRLASPMHDIGKLGVPEAILSKPGRLTAEERAEIERHPEVGYRILAGSQSPLLQMAATIAWTHHERWDGTGYPCGLAGEDIPLEGRIAAIADVFDALTRDRVYRPRIPRQEAIEIMRAGRGTHFDPALLDAFLVIVEEDVPARG